MKVSILAIGKKHDPKLSLAIEEYSNRLKHYCALDWVLLEAKATRSMSPDQIKDNESQVLLDKIKRSDTVILLDERGKELNTPQFAEILQNHMNQATERLVFVIGGAYGVNQTLMNRADLIWKLSDLVFPHQLVRTLVTEQLYRAYTILAGEKYHHL